MDYIFRRLALEYLPVAKREELGIKSISERKEEAAASAGDAAPPAPQPVEAPTLRSAPASASETALSAKAIDAPLCYSCGSKMQPAGSCYVCTACGSTSGCS
jgi:ribonucleoside-diphosphate reductase alpha chain